ncbi:MAG: hypothetical protein ACI8YQ_004438 [Polaribacter sp.]|jgi:hypothetical protein
MIDLFQKFNEGQEELLVDAIPLITILIAGADGNIDDDEKSWGAKLTKIRSYSYPELLNEYYKTVGATYSDKVESYIKSLPSDVDARSAAISEKLTGLNGLLAQLDQADAHIIYKSFLTFAEHVAKASGGFLRIGAISNAESKLMGLPMITAIEQPEEEA